MNCTSGLCVCLINFLKKGPCPALPPRPVQIEKTENCKYGTRVYLRAGAKEQNSQPNWDQVVVGIRLELSSSACRTWLLFDLDAFVVSVVGGGWKIVPFPPPIIPSTHRPIVPSTHHPNRKVDPFQAECEICGALRAKESCQGATFVVCWSNCRKLVLTPD